MVKSTCLVEHSRPPPTSPSRLNHMTRSLLHPVHFDRRPGEKQSTKLHYTVPPVDLESMPSRCRLEGDSVRSSLFSIVQMNDDGVVSGFHLVPHAGSERPIAAMPPRKLSSCH